MGMTDLYLPLSYNGDSWLDLAIGGDREAQWLGQDGTKPIPEVCRTVRQTLGSASADRAYPVVDKSFL